MFLRSGLLSSFAGLFIWVKNKRFCYVVVVSSHSRRFLSGICRFVREQSRQKQIPERCGPPHTREWPLIDNKTPGNSKNSPGVFKKRSFWKVSVQNLLFSFFWVTADPGLQPSRMTAITNPTISAIRPKRLFRPGFVFWFRQPFAAIFPWLHLPPF